MDFDSSGVRLSYDRLGSGEPVLLIMGLGTPRLGWALQMPVLAEHFDVVAFDNRGIGESDSPDEQWTMEDMVNDAIALMDHLGWESAHLVGISMGGMIAQEIAIRHPSRVRRLALISTMAGGATQVLPAMDVYDAMGEDTPAERRLQKGIEITFGEKFRRENPAAIQMFVSLMIGDETGLGIGSRGFFMQTLAIGMWSNVGGCYDRLAQIQAPTIVIHGDADALIPVGNGHLIAESIPEARKLIYPEIGHAINIELAETVNRELIAHLTARDQQLV